MLGVTE